MIALNDVHIIIHRVYQTCARKGSIENWEKMSVISTSVERKTNFITGNVVNH